MSFTYEKLMRLKKAQLAEIILQAQEESAEPEQEAFSHLLIVQNDGIHVFSNGKDANAFIRGLSQSTGFRLIVGKFVHEGKSYRQLVRPRQTFDRPYS